MNSVFDHITPASAAPPQAASGGGAKPRNELEAFVMLWSIVLKMYGHN